MGSHHRFEFQPGRAIGPFELGMTPEEVSQVVVNMACEDFEISGRPDFDRAFANSLQIDYDPETSRAARVSVYWHPDCGYECDFNGKPIAAYSSREIFEFLARLDGGVHEYEQQTGYRFPIAGVSLFDLDKDYDYSGDGQTLVYGEVGVIIPTSGID
ncbi:hypothetical protein [Thalassoroseus pseudoceratinae]|uniref:hypothetical protein n=1 Tax=Thalassoroseus pseudoceratinae TaxID=2713176 RepID=UPI001422A6E9|nr:hypothetical protein [Thalassoroseus pseudoceratinae]